MNLRILIKIGGKAFEGREGFEALASAIKGTRNAEVIIVHGGGIEISQALEEANRETVFVDGIRVTQAEDIEIVEDVLSERINRRIAAFLSEGGISCKRMSGKTDNLLTVEPLSRKGQDFGYVGRIMRVNPKPILDSLRNGQVPVVSPISADEQGMSYNVNADSAAAALAVGSQCSDLVYFTDVPGVRAGEDIQSSLSIQEAEALIASGTIKAGMVAKMESAFEALKGKVERVHITRWEGQHTLRSIIERQWTTGTTIQL